MWLLLNMSPEHLQAACRCRERGALSQPLLDGIRWLLSEDAADADKIENVLRSADPLFRKFGAVAAAKLRKENTEPLAFASTMDDDDIKIFADRLRSD